MKQTPQPGLKSFPSPPHKNVLGMGDLFSSSFSSGSVCRQSIDLRNVCTG